MGKYRCRSTDTKRKSFSVLSSLLIRVNLDITQYFTSPLISIDTLRFYKLYLRIMFN